MDDLPKHTKMIKRFIPCANPNCKQKHGPYIYLEWKQNRQRYSVRIGKSDKHYKQILLKRQVGRKGSVIEVNHIEFMRKFSGGYLVKRGPIEDYFDMARSHVWAAKKISEMIIHAIDAIEEELSEGCNCFHFSYMVSTKKNERRIIDNYKRALMLQAETDTMATADLKRKGLLPNEELLRPPQYRQLHSPLSSKNGLMAFSCPIGEKD